MNETLTLILAAGAGILLGVLFFGGLWWTVRRGLASHRPVLWFFGSLLLRTSLALAGFFLVAGNQWQRLLACLGGFVLARVVLTRWLRPAKANQNRPPPEASHAT